MNEDVAVFCPTCGGHHAPFKSQRPQAEPPNRVPYVNAGPLTTSWGNCAACGFYRPLKDEPDGTRVCHDCYMERNGYEVSAPSSTVGKP
jgi:hypothetical protein